MYSLILKLIKLIVFLINLHTIYHNANVFKNKKTKYLIYISSQTLCYETRKLSSATKCGKVTKWGKSQGVRIELIPQPIPSQSTNVPIDRPCEIYCSWWDKWLWCGIHFCQTAERGSEESDTADCAGKLFVVLWAANLNFQQSWNDDGSFISVYLSVYCTFWQWTGRQVICHQTSETWSLRVSIEQVVVCVFLSVQGHLEKYA